MTTFIANRLRLSLLARLRLVCGLLLCLGAGWSAAMAASLTASLDRSTASVGESVTLNLVLEGVNLQQQPNLPTIPGIEVLGVSASQNMSVINGQVSAQTTYSYQIVVNQPGDFTIPTLSLPYNGQNLTTQPLKLKVTPPTQVTGQQGAAFMQIVLPKKEMYLGEVLPVEIRFYAAQNIQITRLPQLAADGFTLTPMPGDPPRSRTQMNGQAYTVFTFRMALGPLRTGAMILGPATAPVNILSEPRRNVFGEVQYLRSQPATITSESNVLEVLPLPPENRPANFSGAIGSYALQVTASPTEVAVGDPITVRVRIEGAGALEALQLPEQSAWREFKTYEPTSSLESGDPLKLQGAKNFEWVVSPQNAGVKELPEFTFSFFDPEQKTYRTLTQPAIPLKVRATAATPQPTVAATAGATPETTPRSKDIVHIKQQAGTLQAASPPLVREPWFWGLQAVAPFLWAGSIFLRKRREHLDRNPRLRRQREVIRTINDGLATLKQQAAANESEAFFATVFRLLQEQIGERLDLPANAITEAVVDDQLRTCGLDAAARALLQELFQTCNQARYAPVQSKEALTAIVPKLEQALAALREMKS